MLISEAVENSVVLLDGGLATLLEAGGHDLSDALWSARLLQADPEAIIGAHREFFAAGAQVATTASYQASVSGFAAAGIGAEEAARLIRSSVRLAREARDQVAPHGWVAASVGPYGAVLADGSEYRGDYGLSVAELRSFHRPRLELLLEESPDLLAVETIPCLAEVEAVLAEVSGAGVPVWLSLTTTGGRTRAGEPVAEAYAMAAEVAEVFAVGVNCLDPNEVTATITGAPLPAVAYPNSGQGWDAVGRRWTGEPAFEAEAVTDWVDAGARLVGGCCRVGPEQIRDVARLLGIS